MPRPPTGFSSASAPICGARRPATSLIGASSGSRPSSVSTVSYAMQIAPEATRASRQLARRREVQVREEDLPRSQPSELDRERLLDLEHEVARLPHLVDPREPRARPDVGLVGECAADARTGLDDDLVALRGELARAAGREGDAVLVGLDLADDADLHRVAAAADVLSCSITRRSLRGGPFRTTASESGLQTAGVSPDDGRHSHQ